MNGENGYYYTIAPYVANDGYMTVADALKEPQAKGLSEQEFRDMVTTGRIVGTDGSPVRTFNGFFNDWIIPAGFRILKPGLKIPPLPKGPK